MHSAGGLAIWVKLTQGTCGWTCRWNKQLIINFAFLNVSHLKFRNRRIRHLRETLKINSKKESISYFDFFFNQFNFLFLAMLFIIFLYLWISFLMSNTRANLFNFINNFNLNRSIFFSFLKFYFNKVYNWFFLFLYKKKQTKK